MSMPANDNSQPKAFDLESAQALFWKVFPIIIGALGAIGWIPTEWVDYLKQNAATLSAAVSTIGGAAVVVYSVWKNRPAKRIADVANIPGVDVAAPPDLAAKATSAATADAKASITAKAA